MNPAERMKYLRFQLSTLATDNNHHAFEHVCFFLAKRHVAPNLVYPTGPVSSGGDQARDFETFRCHLGGEDIVFACTTQQTGIDGKIRGDVETATTTGEHIDAVYAMLSTDYSVGNRHKLIAKIREEFDVRLEILDREWIADKLSETATFWIAQHFLGVPDEFAPPTSESTQRVSRQLAPDLELADRLELLPITAANALSHPEAEAYRPFVEIIVDGILRGDPKSVLEGWAGDEPVWIRDAPGVLLVALGHLAIAFELPEHAMRYFERAGASGFDSGRSYVVAASQASQVAPDRIEEFHELARAAGSEDLVTVAVAAMNADWKALIEMINEGEVFDEPLLVLPYIGALQGNGRIDAAISFLRRYVARFPRNSGQAIVLAQFLGWRGSQPHNSNRQADQRDAVEGAIQARDVRRSWRGDSGEAVRWACQAALVAGRHDDAIRLGTAAPDGEAFDFEADDPGVKFAVAQASIALGRLDAANLVAASATGFEKALLIGDILQAEQAPQVELDGAFLAAWELVESEADKITFWLSAAGAGVDPLPGADELAARHDELSILCQSMSLIARKHYEEAIGLLRPRRDLERARRLLTNAYLFSGRLDDGVAELIDMSKRFANVEHAIQAVRVLVGSDRLEEAAVLAADVLTAVAPGRRERAFLHEVGVAAATQQQDWGAVERRTHAWITDAGRSPHRHWVLVQAIFNQGDPDRAWQLVLQDEACSVERPMAAALWIALHHRFRPGIETLRAALRFAATFPADPNVRRSATNAVVNDGMNAELSEEEAAQFRELLEARKNSNDPDDPIVTITVPDDEEGLIEAFRPILEEQAQRVAAVLDRVRKERLPLGLISMVAGRPYTKIFVQRALGYLPIAAANPDVAAQEVEIAAAAVEAGHVMVDVSAIAVGWFQQEVWPTLVGSFVTVSVTVESKRDVAASIDVGLADSSHSLGWDVRAGRPILHEIDPAAVARVKEHIDWVAGQISHMSVAETSPGDSRPAWIVTVEAAKAGNVPLWADDEGLRRVARQEGVEAFGTDSLMGALRDAGRIETDRYEAGLIGLREEFCGDFPLDREWMIASAVQEEWRGGPALLAMSRPSTWQEPQDAFAVWVEILLAVANDDPSKLPPWSYAAATGIAQAFREPLQVVELTASVLMQVVFASDGDPAALAACAPFVAAAVEDFGIPDPLELTLHGLLLHAIRTAGPEAGMAELERLGSQLVGSQAETLQGVLAALHEPPDESGESPDTTGS